MDDSTSMNDKNTNYMLKLFTQSRHANCDVIFANHYINNLNIAFKSHITDFLIWGPICSSKLEKFYEDICDDNIGCTSPEHEMNLEIFLDMFYKNV